MTSGAHHSAGYSASRRSETRRSRLSVPESTAVLCEMDENLIPGSGANSTQDLGARKGVGAKEKAPAAPRLSVFRPKREDGDESTY